VTANWKKFFLPSVKGREVRDTRALYNEVQVALQSSPFKEGEVAQHFIHLMVVEICAAHGQVPSRPLGNALWNAIAGFLVTEGMAIELQSDDVLERLTMEEGAQLRAILRRSLEFLRDHDRLLPLWRRKLVSLFTGMLEYFPPSAFTDVDEDGNSLDDAIVLPEAKALALVENLPEVIDRTIITFFDEDIRNAHLFDRMRERLDTNGAVASGSLPDDRNGKVVMPSEQKNKTPDFLVPAYLGGTPLQDFFESGLPFAIPFPARFEHTHIIGGTGHGKTQLLQFLINHDLVRAQEDNRSVIVMDSQGDLIRTISRLKYFSPDEDGSLADRFVLIDPTDVEHPVALAVRVCTAGPGKGAQCNSRTV
jgi:hypothetical protein